MRSSDPCRNDSGFTLIEALLSIAILTGIFLAGSQYIFHHLRLLSHQRLLATQANLTSSLLRLAGMPQTLYASIASKQPENGMLSACLWGGGTCDGTPGAYHDIRLYAPYGEVQSGGFRTGGAFTGTSSYPFRYSRLGLPCDTSSGLNACPGQNFPIEVYTDFNAVCPPNADGFYYPTAWNTNILGTAALQSPTTCGMSEYVEIRIHISYAGSSSTNGIEVATDSFPSFTLSTYVNSATVY